MTFGSVEGQFDEQTFALGDGLFLDLNYHGDEVTAGDVTLVTWQN